MPKVDVPVSGNGGRGLQAGRPCRLTCPGVLDVPHCLGGSIAALRRHQRTRQRPARARRRRVAAD